MWYLSFESPQDVWSIIGLSFPIHNGAFTVRPSTCSVWFSWYSLTEFCKCTQASQFVCATAVCFRLLVALNNILLLLRSCFFVIALSGVYAATSASFLPLRCIHLKPRSLQFFIYRGYANLFPPYITSIFPSYLIHRSTYPNSRPVSPIYIFGNHSYFGAVKSVGIFSTL